MKAGAELVVTTAKDFVKLQPLWGSEDLVQLHYGIKLIKGERELADHLITDGIDA